MITSTVLLVATTLVSPPDSCLLLYVNPERLPQLHPNGTVALRLVDSTDGQAWVYATYPSGRKRVAAQFAPTVSHDTVSVFDPDTYEVDFEVVSNYGLAQEGRYLCYGREGQLKEAGNLWYFDESRQYYPRVDFTRYSPDGSPRLSGAYYLNEQSYYQGEVGGMSDSTGRWTTYFADGSVEREWGFDEDGVRTGGLVTFNASGDTVLVGHYEHRLQIDTVNCVDPRTYETIPCPRVTRIPRFIRD